MNQQGGAHQTYRIPGTVLIADDHAMFRFGLMRFLREKCEAATVHEAETFDAAVELLSDKSISLAIFDLDMPGLTMVSDLAVVRRRRPDVRCVVLTGSTDRGDVLEALAVGMHGFIVKDCGLDSMIDRLAYVMSGEVYVPPFIADCAAAPSAEPRRAAPAEAKSATSSPALAQPLSVRQRQVLEGIVVGMSNKEIARRLDISEGTVKMHIGALYRVLGASNRAHAVSLGKRLID